MRATLMLRFTESVYGRSNTRCCSIGHYTRLTALSGDDHDDLAAHFAGGRSKVR